MGQQRLQALRVLAARRTAGAELRPHGQPHLGRPARHEGELCRLVQQLVQADPDEVEVHHLHHRAQTGHGRPDREADDGRLRDRGVTDPLAEAFPQAAGEAEDVAALPHVDAGQEDPVVLGELLLQRTPDGIHGADFVGPFRNDRRLVRTRPLPKDEVEEPVPRGRSERAGTRRRLVELGRHRGLDRLDLGLGHTGGGQPAALHDQRVARLPLPHLLRRAVALWVPFVVAVPAVGGRLHHGRATAPRRVDDRLHGLRRGDDVVAVDQDVWQGVAGRPLLQRRRVLGGRRRELGVPVVLAEEDDGQVPHCGQVESLVKGALRGRAVSEERDGHAVTAPDLRRRRRTDGDREAGRHDAVRAEDPELRVRDVHRTAPAPVGPPLAGHELREHPEGVETLGQAVAVPPVRGRDHVVGPQPPAGSHGGGFLSDRQVHESRHQAVAVEHGDTLLEPPDPHHAAMHLQEIGDRHRPRLVLPG